MGTSSVKVLRRKNRCICLHYDAGGHPSKMAARILHKFRTRQTSLHEYIEELSEMMDYYYPVRKDFSPDSCSVFVNEDEIEWWPSLHPPSPGLIQRDRWFKRISYVYTIDLDNLVFLINGFPLLRLDNLPSDKDIRKCTRLVSVEDEDKKVEVFEWSHLIMSQRYYALFNSPPPEEVLQWPSSNPEPKIIGDLSARRALDLPYTLSHLEQAHLYILTTRIIGCLDCPEWSHPLHVEFPALRSRADIDDQMKYVAAALVEWFFEPLVSINNIEISKIDGPKPDQREICWWPRQDVCLSMDTHLSDPTYLETAIKRVVGKMVEDRAESYARHLFGVVLSISHIVIFRFNRKSNSLRHTGPLEFLHRTPDLAKEIPPGIVALCRLARMTHSNIIQNICTFFNSYQLRHYDRALHAWWNPYFRRKRWGDLREKDIKTIDMSGIDRNLPESSPLSTLPIEILSHIAVDLDPLHLLFFALLSKQTAKACEFLLRYPYLDMSRLEGFNLKLGWSKGYLSTAGPSHQLNDPPDNFLLGFEHRIYADPSGGIQIPVVWVNKWYFLDIWYHPTRKLQVFKATLKPLGPVGDV